MSTQNKKILSLVSEDYDDLELFYPMIRLREAGFQVDLAAVKKGSYQGKFGLSTEVPFAFEDIHIEDYDGVLVPGGWAPDKLRRYDQVLEFVKYMDQHNKVIGIICHAGWVLSSADILKGRTVTSTPGIKHDLMHAGAIWVDQAAVRDRNLVSGRRPPDLHVYLPLLIEALNEC